MSDRYQDLNSLNSYGLVVLDGGARNGPKDLQGLDSICSFHCFEPNDQELLSADWSVSDISKVATGHRGVCVYPYALGAATGSVVLNVSIRPGSTSTLQPNEVLLERFSKDHFSEMRHITRQVRVPSITLQDFMERSGLDHLDLIKLDTQGNELDILKSAGPYLGAVSVVMVEVEMIPLYKEQPLFHDVAKFMADNGFEFVDLQSNPTCRRFHARDDLPPSAYRMVWGDAIFARRLDDANKARAVEQGLALAGLGYADLAIDLWSRCSRVTEEQLSSLEAFARWAAEPHYASGRIRRMMERMFGVLLQRYDWRRGHQVVSRLGSSS